MKAGSLFTAHQRRRRTKAAEGWHVEARKLFDAGDVGVDDLMVRFNKTRSTVRYALDLDNAKQKHRERVQKQRGGLVERPAPALRSDAPRAARVMDAARLFARGEIDRAELSRRLKGCSQ